MDPVLVYGLGASAGALLYAAVTRAWKEGYLLFALAMGVLAGLAGGGILAWQGWPPVPGLGKRLVATALTGVSAVLGGANLSVFALAGSGGFSSARDHARILVALFAILLAFCVPHARPG